MAIVLILVGIFSLVGAGLDKDWFMEARKARFLTRLLGERSKVRIFYLILGSGMIIAGILGVIGIIDLS